MKKLLSSIIILLIACYACGGGGDETNGTSEVDTSLNAPGSNCSDISGMYHATTNDCYATYDNTTYFITDTLRVTQANTNIAAALSSGNIVATGTIDGDCNLTLSANVEGEDIVCNGAYSDGKVATTCEVAGITCTYRAETVECILNSDCNDSDKSTSQYICSSYSCKEATLNTDEVIVGEAPEPTEVYDYFEKDGYVVYVDTSLYLGTYSKDKNVILDTCSNDFFLDTLADQVKLIGLSTNQAAFSTSGIFFPYFVYDSDWPHFDGADNLNYWYTTSQYSCSIDISSLYWTNNYKDYIFMACANTGNVCSLVYEKDNMTAVKSVNKGVSISYTEDIEDMLNLLEEKVREKVQNK